MIRFLKRGTLLFMMALVFCNIVPVTAGISDLPDELRELVDAAGDFSGYALLTADEDTLLGTPKDLSVFVLSRGDVCVLFGATQEDEGWKLQGYSRSSLYPSLIENVKLQIRKIDEERFELSWPGERFAFYCGGTDHYGLFYNADIETNDEQYLIKKNDDENGLWFYHGEESSYWDVMFFAVSISWQKFNPLVFPRNFEDVERLNMMAKEVPGKRMFVSTMKLEAKELNRNLKLYNCPDTTSRAVDRSTLFTSAKFSYHGMYGDWHFIEYQNGMEQAYFVYFQKEYFPFDKREESISKKEFMDVPLEVEVDTFLTDDPILSQTPIAVLPKGTRMIGLSGWDAYYVYVEVELMDEIVRGFVPAKDLVSDNKE